MTYNMKQMTEIIEIETRVHEERKLEKQAVKEGLWEDAYNHAKIKRTLEATYKYKLQRFFEHLKEQGVVV